MSNIPETALQLRTEVTSDAKLQLSLAEIPVPQPGPHQVLVEVHAAPVNPSDQGLLFGFADLDTLKSVEVNGRPAAVADMPEVGMRAAQARVGESMAAGNEGSGIVVAAGEGAEHLMGKMVAGLGGEFYGNYRMLALPMVMPLPDGTSAADGASCFVNPLTSLAMTETMRMEGHSALIHTAAASNLGQMLNKICLADGIPLVNIVRKPEQEKILRDIGATHVVNSSAESFMPDLIAAVKDTGAKMAFDAIGGGPLAEQILLAIEAAAMEGQEFNRYGSDVDKRVYIYGRLDLGKTTIGPGVGLSWTVAGFLLTPFLGKIGAEGRARLQARVASELTTTFASHYTAEISLEEAMDPDVLKAMAKKATGEKYLITPNKG